MDMGGINVGRWIGGGVAAGIVMWLLEGASSTLTFDDMQTALQAHGLSMEMSPIVWALTIILSLMLGLFVVFFYAVARARFGPGPGTAAIAGIATWVGAYLPSLIGYHMINLYPPGMLAMWAVIGLVEMIAAALVGGWIYRERTAM